MTLLESNNRRTVLKTLGAGIAGGTVLTGTATARENLISRGVKAGPYSVFPVPTTLNRRSKNPIDFREDNGDGRWVSEPARGGKVRCRVENNGASAPNLPSAAFVIEIGSIGDIESITIDGKSVESDGDAARLTAELIFDVGGDGDYFEWVDLKGNSERFVGFGDDAAAFVLPFSFPANESFTIDDDTKVSPPTPPKNETFGDYTEGEGIDTDTKAGIGIGVLGGGDETVEEAIIEEVSVTRS